MPSYILKRGLDSGLHPQIKLFQRSVGRTCMLLRENVMFIWNCLEHKMLSTVLGNTGWRPPKSEEGNDITLISHYSPKSMPFCTDSATLAVWIWQFWGFLLSYSSMPAIFSCLSHFPSVQFGSPKLASKAVRELHQILAQITCAISPLPSRNELILGVPTPSSFKYNLQRESKLGCGLDFPLGSVTSD